MKRRFLNTERPNIGINSLKTLLSKEYFDYQAPASGPNLIAIDGVWKSVSNRFIAINGSWRTVQKISVVVDGVWRTSYSSGLIEEEEKETL